MKLRIINNIIIIIILILFNIIYKKIAYNKKKYEKFTLIDEMKDYAQKNLKHNKNGEYKKKKVQLK